MIDHPPLHEESQDQPTFHSILRELLDCTELNMDDLEEHTRVVIQKAQELLAKQATR